MPAAERHRSSINLNTSAYVYSLFNWTKDYRQIAYCLFVSLSILFVEYLYTRIEFYEVTFLTIVTKLLL